ncbi:MAG: hypothetical protein IJP52_05390 [Paludibacteraceae bacterium]|nr:hypothetical protein [Paludibacteraceae bacterium]
MSLKQFYMAVFLIVMGVGMLFTGLLLPPQGEISPSVLVAYGETLTFVGSVIGIDYNYRSKQGNHQDK